MCVIFFYVNSNPGPGGYKLILASNRDEFYGRETKSASKWPVAGHVYGGIDLEPGREGGTWLAIGGHNGVLKAGALLNLTGEPKPRKAIGRGMIVSDFVSSTAPEGSIANYNQRLVADCEKYSAFNFVSIEIGERSTPASIMLCSNVPSGLTHYEEGKCYGFGNSLPTVPFQKVRCGQERFETIVNDFLLKHQQIDQNHKAQEELIASLQDLLKCKQKFWPDAELLRRAPNWGEHLSAINVDIPHQAYGSRTHTIILVDEFDAMHFFEETMATQNPAGKWQQTHIRKQFFE